MTEQWQELKETITELRDNDGTSTQQEVCKFLANLMDVLEKQMQEPCEDAISRQAIIKTLNKMDRYVADELTLCDTERKFPQNEVFIVDDVYEEIVEQLPSVNPQEPKTGWIPVSEKLPEKPDNYPYCGIHRTYFLVSLASGCVETLGYEFDRDKWQVTGSPVVAWMPLPESYEASPTGAKFEEVKNDG